MRRPKIHGRGPAPLSTSNYRCCSLHGRQRLPSVWTVAVAPGHQCGTTSGEGPQVNPASSNSSAAPVPVMPGPRDLLLLRLRQVALTPSRGSRLAVPVPVETSSQGHCHAVSRKPVTSLFVPLSFHSGPEKMSEHLHLPYMARLCPYSLIW
jgi:hypothetical protein